MANTKILSEGLFQKIFVQPAANDAWVSLGSSLYGYHIFDKNTQRITYDVYSWNTYSHIYDSLKQYSDYIHIEEVDSQVIAQHLSDGKIISIFQNGSEFWPRALGNRSILASPIRSKWKDRLNFIKWRQYWRPVACMIMEEYENDYFTILQSDKYMTLAAILKPEFQSILGSISHVDGSCRYQTVTKDSNPRIYQILWVFKELTGYPLLINTSFNLNQQPIVETPEDAIKTFLSSEIDFLLIDNFLVSKEKIYSQFRFNPEINKLKLYFAGNLSEVSQYLKNWEKAKSLLFWTQEVGFIVFLGWFWFRYSQLDVHIDILLSKKITWDTWKVFSDLAVEMRWNSLYLFQDFISEFEDNISHHSSSLSWLFFF